MTSLEITVTSARLHAIDNNSVCLDRSFQGGSDPFVHVDPGTSHEARHVIDAGEHPNMGTAKAEFNDAQYVKDLRGAFSSVPKPRARWQDRYLKLMIVGETGQGRFCLPLVPLLSRKP